MVSYSHHEWNEHHKLELIQEQARPQLNMSNCSWLCQIINERTSRFSFYTWRVFNTKQLHTLLSWSLGRVREVRQGMNVRLKASGRILISFSVWQQENADALYHFGHVQLGGLH